MDGKQLAPLKCIVGENTVGVYIIIHFIVLQYYYVYTIVNYTK